MARLYSPAPSLTVCFPQCWQMEPTGCWILGVNRPISSTADSVVRLSPAFRSQCGVVTVLGTGADSVSYVEATQGDVCGKTDCASFFSGCSWWPLHLHVFILDRHGCLHENDLPIDRTAVRVGYLWSQHICEFRFLLLDQTSPHAASKPFFFFTPHAAAIACMISTINVKQDAPVGGLVHHSDQYNFLKL